MPLVFTVIYMLCDTIVTRVKGVGEGNSDTKPAQRLKV